MLERVIQCRTMLKLDNQIGILNNFSIEDKVTGMQNPFCAKKGSHDNLFVTDPFNNRIIVYKEDVYKYITTKEIKDWFPRWITLIPDTDLIVFVDSRNKILGTIQSDGKLLNSVQIDMKEPLYVSMSSKNSLFVCGRGEHPLIEYDTNFKIQKYFLNDGFGLQAAERFQENMFLLCDLKNSQINIVDEDGKSLWMFGGRNKEGGYELNTPKCVTHRDNHIYVADSGNSRVLEIEIENKGTLLETKSVIEIKTIENEQLWWPVSVDVYNRGLIVVDSYMNKVWDYEIDNPDKKTDCFGCKSKIEFLLNRPRSIDAIDNTLLVADTYNNRIVVFDRNFKVLNVYENNFYWPKCARYYRNMIIVADSRNNRVVFQDRSGKIIKTIESVIDKGKSNKLEDVHDIDIYDGELILTDSERNVVMICDMSGNVISSYTDLKDPHQARMTKNKTLLISDTGNNRIIEIKDGVLINELTTVDGKPLRLPRWCEYYNRDRIIVSDAGNNRILITDWNGSLYDSFGGYYELSNRGLRGPRCVKKIGEYIYISDTHNNRMVRLSKCN